MRVDLPLIFQKVNHCDGINATHLDVRITAFCDCSCSFCIAAEGMKHKRKFDLEAMLAQVERLQPKSVSIIGGEPLLFLKNLKSFMGEAKKLAPIEAYYITTSLPHTVVTQRELFLEVLELTEVLNVSIQHYDWQVNNAILQAKNKFNRLKALGELLQVVPSEKVRVHLNLSRGGIDTQAKLHAAFFTLKELGVTEVKLNELMDAPADYISFEEVTGLELPSPYAHGCSTDLAYFPGLHITLKRSCFLVEASRAASKLDLLKLEYKQELEKPRAGRAPILYEDGHVAEVWEEGREPERSVYALEESEA